MTEPTPPLWLQNFCALHSLVIRYDRTAPVSFAIHNPMSFYDRLGLRNFLCHLYLQSPEDWLERLNLELGG